MVAVTDPPSVPPRPASSVPVNPQQEAGIVAYLGAGDGMARIMGLTMVLCAALIVVVAIAWAIGVLPGAVKLI